MNASFYETLTEGNFRATAATVGPWSPLLQHGSPPAALLARAIERNLPRDDARIARIAFDFLGTVPVGELAVESEIVRPGARIELSRARMTIGGRAALQATAWRIATATDRSPAAPSVEAIPALPGPQTQQFFDEVPSFGYGEALEWRFVEGAFAAIGPATVWARPRIPLIEGEEISPLSRLLLMADSANGISAELPPGRFTFVPVELTVSVQRYPRSEWVGMRARTTIESDGIGLTRADLFDEHGWLGLAVQTLFVSPR